MRGKKPELNDRVRATVGNPPYDIEGTVVTLLSSQFIVYTGKTTRLVMYDGEWSVIKEAK